MKKLKFNEAIAGYGDPSREGSSRFSFAPDQVAEVEDDLAVAWVESGIASWAPKEPKPVAKAEFAVAKAPEVSKTLEVKTVEPKVEVVEVPKVVAKAEDKKEG